MAMKLKFRVTTHNFVDEKLTQVQFQGTDGTNGNANLTMPRAAAADYPVGGVVEATLGTK
jgi:hypothetical protein